VYGAEKVYKAAEKKRKGKPRRLLRTADNALHVAKLERPTGGTTCSPTGSHSAGWGKRSRGTGGLVIEPEPARRKKTTPGPVHTGKKYNERQTRGGKENRSKERGN